MTHIAFSVFLGVVFYCHRLFYYVALLKYFQYIRFFVYTTSSSNNNNEFRNNIKKTSNGGRLHRPMVNTPVGTERFFSRCRADTD